MVFLLVGKKWGKIGWKRIEFSDYFQINAEFNIIEYW